MNKKLIITFAVIFLITLITASTFPGIPHQFYGSVVANGIFPRTGDITAKIDNKIVGSTKVSAGKYGYNPIFFISDPEYNLNGKKIIFYFNSNKAGEYIFENGGSTRLDLIVGEYEGFCGDSILGKNEECDDGEKNGVKCDNSERDCTYCSSSCKLITLEEEDGDDGNNDRDNERELLGFFSDCEPDWECSGWSKCANGVMKRECKDKNECSEQYNKPNEITGCELEIAEKSLEEEKPFKLNAFFIILSIATLILIIILIALAGRKPKPRKAIKPESKTKPAAKPEAKEKTTEKDESKATAEKSQEKRARKRQNRKKG